MTKTLIFFSNRGGEGTTSLALRTAWLAATHGIDTLLIDACEGYSQGDIRTYVDDSYILPSWPDALIVIDGMESHDGLDSACVQSEHADELRVVDAGHISTGSNEDYRTTTLIRALRDGALGARVTGPSNSSVFSFQSFTDETLAPNHVATESLATIVNECWPSGFTAKEKAGFRAAWREHLDEESEFVEFDRKFSHWINHGDRRTQGKSFTADPVLARLLGRAGALDDDEVDKAAGPQNTPRRGMSRLLRPGHRYAA